MKEINKFHEKASKEFQQESMKESREKYRERSWKNPERKLYKNPGRNVWGIIMGLLKVFSSISVINPFGNTETRL